MHGVFPRCNFLESEIARLRGDVRFCCSKDWVKMTTKAFAGLLDSIDVNQSYLEAKHSGHNFPWLPVVVGEMIKTHVLQQTENWSPELALALASILSLFNDRSRLIELSKDNEDKDFRTMLAYKKFQNIDQESVAEVKCPMKLRVLCNKISAVKLRVVHANLDLNFRQNHHVLSKTGIGVLTLTINEYHEISLLRYDPFTKEARDKEREVRKQRQITMQNRL